MSHLGKLINKATNINLNLENNSIGNYTISPQHGINCICYNIYKGDNIHIITITISDNNILLEYVKHSCTGNEVVNVHTELQKLYPSFKIVIENI